jgi:hypothetical protein
MDEDAEKEFEQMQILSYDKMVAEGLIIPARNPQRVFAVPKGKIKKGKQLSEILIEDRRSARY